MKRFWLILLSLGIVLAFSASAMAVDVKFSGEFYAAGMYLDKTTFMKNTASDGPSTALYYQGLRVRTDFIVSPGLKLVTRFDAMQRAWGAQRTAPGTTLDLESQGTKAENQNIAFDWTYVEYVSPIGQFQVGIMSDGAWGTVFGDGDTQLGKINWAAPLGPLWVGAYIGKAIENSRTANLNPLADPNAADQDWDRYLAWFIYPINKNIEAGLLYNYNRIAIGRPTGASPAAPFNLFHLFYGNFLATAHQFNPYAKVKIGPVKMEAEMNYTLGKAKFEEPGIIGTPGMELDIQNWSAYFNAVADFGTFYFGGTFAYVSGDDPSTTDKLEGAFLDGGTNFNPCLILFNYERTYWAGVLPGYSAATADGPMTNAWFYQGQIGVRPTSSLDIRASLAYAVADQKPTSAWISKNYGTEVDVTVTYKITDNLKYMLGMGYLFTGEYFKGTTSSDVRDNYMVINKLTLTF